MYTYADKTVLGLEVLEGFNGIVDQGETGSLTTTKVGLETEDGNNFLVRLVHLGKLLTELILGDGGATGMDDINNHLLALEQAVRKELASADSNSCSVSL